MQKSSLKPWHGLSLLLVTALCIAPAPAYAEKPGRGHGNEHKEFHHEKHGRSKQQDSDEKWHNREEAAYPSKRYFNDQHRLIINQYYGGQYRSGNCPPGLKKKHNGCMPPGQAQKWRIGQPLPRGLVYYDIPPAIIGPAPAGYRFVRVASDILMIAIGSGMVMDALTDLNGM